MQKQGQPERAGEQQSAGPSPTPPPQEASPQASLLRLQSTAGNRAAGRILARGPAVKPGKRKPSTKDRRPPRKPPAKVEPPPRAPEPVAAWLTA